MLCSCRNDKKIIYNREMIPSFTFIHTALFES
jgi:hypothetical protein